MKENEKIEKETETGEKKPAPKKEPSKKPAKSKESEKLKAELEAAQKELTELKDQHLRTLAEYDNFRKRTVKEKEELSAFCVAGAIEKLLPALDALDAAEKIENADVESLKKGIELSLIHILLVAQRSRDVLRNRERLIHEVPEADGRGALILVAIVVAEAEQMGELVSEGAVFRKGVARRIGDRAAVARV